MTVAQAILDRYRILGEPATFPLGGVYSGFDPFADRAISLYEVAPGHAGFRPGLLVEDVREGARVSHPNLLPALAEIPSQTGPSYLVTATAKGVRLDMLATDKGLTAQGALHIMRIMANLLEYCWKSGIKGCGFGTKSIYVAPEGIRFASIAESRLLARAAGRELNGRAGDITDFSEILAATIELCRRAGNSCDQVEAVDKALREHGFLAARNLLNGIADTADDKDEEGRKTLTRLDAGDFLFKEGDPSDDTFFVLESGLVQVLKADPSGNEMFLDLTQPGQLIGEMAVIDRLPRMATVRAIEPCQLLIIRGTVFRSRLAKTEKVAMMLIETLSRRLRQRADEITSLKSALGGNR
ncbi:hypothetical protein CU669_05430 [Paramagnetospirillum kuznetsovii]|uniref:Cyclic nucleotide-binding domain-containing protein n=1 Tax=Paramagnetospirillum kuznetsovii TaxID=2053833 RepID=A0A364P0Q0_9PROT|nr:cyclic nucleotide-binding domain-containing protein [Paramagnetospirillum kuznetsovii]RAU22830.1 hypothetical protein CU669_05430 [Paramagnetospirillum kuznetsovii]